jgi:hypothetical protein
VSCANFRTDTTLTGPLAGRLKVSSLYKLQVVPELRNTDKQKRLTTCFNILAMMNQEPLFLQHLLMSDEANFFISGYVNTQNLKYWSLENPSLLHEKPQTSQKVVARCAIGMCGIIGPDFFAPTANADHYCEML